MSSTIGSISQMPEAERDGGWDKFINAKLNVWEELCSSTVLQQPEAKHMSNALLNFCYSELR